jgi:hypothetical protein
MATPPNESTRADRTDVDVTDRTTAPDVRPAGTREVAAPVHVASNGSAVAALVVGMFAVTYAFFAISAIAAIIAGIVAVGLGIKGMGTAKLFGGLHKGLAVSGIVTGALGLLLGIAVIAGGIALFQDIDTSDLPPELQQSIQDATD